MITWTSERSGRASMGVVRTAISPAMSRATTPIRTKKRCLTDRRMRAAIIGPPQQARDGARSDRQDLGATAALPAELDLNGPEAAAGAGAHDQGAFAGADPRCGRNGEPGVRRAGEMYGAEHPGLQTAIPVQQLDVDRERAAVG